MRIRTRQCSSGRPWRLSNRADPCGAALADRHYSRRSPGTRQFVPPGRCVVLLTRAANALWVSSWPYVQYTRHAWPGAWVCTLFRNESPHLLSSWLICEAMGVTRWKWGKPSREGMVTFVDPTQVRPKRDPGYCFLAAGFEYVGRTKTGKVALQIRSGRIPPPTPPSGVPHRCRALRCTYRGSERGDSPRIIQPRSSSRSSFQCSVRRSTKPLLSLTKARSS